MNSGAVSSNVSRGDPPNQAQTPARRAVSHSALQRFAAKAFQRAGLNDGDAEIGAEALALTDAWGVHTHGTNLLPDYLRRLRNGGLRVQGKPHVTAEGPAWAKVDGDSALAMVTSAFAMRTAVNKARRCGIAYVGVRNSCHYGAAGVYAWQAAREGLIGLSMANDKPSVAAPGSRGRVMGTNPISYAVPAGRYRSIMLDMSVATAAAAKVWAALARGEKIPNTWLLDADGKPTTDPNDFPKGGALQPAAGHKGYGIALLIETLAGVLSGAAITNAVGGWLLGDLSTPTDHGAAFIAIDVKVMMPMDDFTRRVEGLVDEIHNAPRAEGVERIYLPGEKEWECYDRSMKTGIVLPPDVIEKLERAAELSQLDLAKELG
jgi:LDH2 family malate/lactate/ureidoglycolate dehydrogenase